MLLKNELLLAEMKCDDAAVSISDVLDVLTISLLNWDILRNNKISKIIKILRPD